MSEYTVSQVAQLSGVSVRTLHHYDEIGLLKPASVGANGYRRYGREELLRLQQILFHRELGFSLEQIRQVIDAPDFDRAKALSAHRERLVREARRYRRLIRTIDRTLAALQGDAEMDDESIYKGFDLDSAEQAQAEAWLRQRFGEKVQARIDHSKATMRGWSAAETAAFREEMHAFDGAIAKAATDGLPAGSAAVQQLMAGHCAWIGKAWGVEPSRGAYLGLAEVYRDNPQFRRRYEELAPGLTAYLTEAMRIYADAMLPA